MPLAEILEFGGGCRLAAKHDRNSREQVNAFHDDQVRLSVQALGRTGRPCGSD
jgi:hypothetical protein